MNTRLTLAIDCGTHAVRALLFDGDGKPVMQAMREIGVQRLSAERVEQDPVEILDATRAVIDEALREAGSSEIGQAGLCTQRSSVLAWDATGTALTPVIGWQDRRAQVEAKVSEADADLLRQITGLRASPHYGAPKLRWLLRHLPALAATQKRGQLRMGPLAAFLLRNLTGSDQLDEANAARTLLWNFQKRHWDPQLLSLFDMPPRLLPEVRPTCADFGRLLETTIPLTAVNGDQGAAVFAEGSPDTGELTINLGTGGFVLMPLGDSQPPAEWQDAGLLLGVISSEARQSQHALEGTINGAGAALSWLEHRRDITDIGSRLQDALAQTSEPPLFVNSVGGLGSPWWRKGPATGFTAGIPENDQTAIAGVAESVLFLVQHNIDALMSLKLPVQRLALSGGLTQSDGLCQRLSDLSGLPARRRRITEASARGIAWLAADGPSGWRTTMADARWQPRRRPELRARYHAFIDLLESDSG